MYTFLPIPRPDVGSHVGPPDPVSAQDPQPGRRAEADCRAVTRQCGERAEENLDGRRYGSEADHCAHRSADGHLRIPSGLFAPGTSLMTKSLLFPD